MFIWERDIKLAIQMIKNGLSVEQAAESLDVSVEDLNRIQKLISIKEKQDERE